MRKEHPAWCDNCQHTTTFEKKAKLAPFPLLYGGTAWYCIECDHKLKKEEVWWE